MMLKYTQTNNEEQLLNIIILLLPSLLVSTTLTFLWWRAYAVARRRLPPTPPGGWPVFGHLHLLGALPHQALANLAWKHGRNGLMSLRLGSVLTIVASTPHSAKLILRTHDQAFSSRPRLAVALHILFNSSDMASSPPCETWRLMRQLCSTQLFSNKRLDSFKPIRQEELRTLLRGVSSQCRKVMLLRPLLLATSYNIISRMAIGQRLSELPIRGTTNVVDLITETAHLFGVFNLGDVIPWLGFLDLQGYEKRMKTVGLHWSSILKDLLELRRSANTKKKTEHGGERGEARMDLLDVLLSVPDLSDNNIKALLLDMFTGGTDTSAIIIEWGLAELLASPPQMLALQEELDRVVGRTRLMVEEDVQNLPYLQAVVKETMRLHPVVPLLAPHESIEACELADQYMIPQKTRVLVNVWAIGRDSKVWEEPLQFEPERFMSGGKYYHLGVHGHDFELLPFGSGRRRCPGISLGLISTHILLASLVQAFHWSLPPEHAKIDFSEEFGLVVAMASPLVITPTSRVSTSLYQE